MCIHSPRQIFVQERRTMFITTCDVCVCVLAYTQLPRTFLTVHYLHANEQCLIILLLEIFTELFTHYSYDCYVPIVNRRYEELIISFLNTCLLKVAPVCVVFFFDYYILLIGKRVFICISTSLVRLRLIKAPCIR